MAAAHRVVEVAAVSAAAEHSNEPAKKEAIKTKTASNNSRFFVALKTKI